MSNTKTISSWIQVCTRDLCRFQNKIWFKSFNKRNMNFSTSELSLLWVLRYETLGCLWTTWTNGVNSWPHLSVLLSATRCPLKSIPKWSWTHMAARCAAPPSLTRHRIPSLSWLVMSVCTCTSRTNGAPASPSTEPSCWLTGIEDICSYSSGTQSLPTSESVTWQSSNDIVTTSSNLSFL